MRYTILIFLAVFLAGCGAGHRKVVQDPPSSSIAEYCPPVHVRLPVVQPVRSRPEHHATKPESPVERKEELGFGGPVEDTAIPEAFRLEDDIREAVIDLALAQLDIQYRYGGVSWETGYDCSGFVRWVFARNGISLPRTSRSQAGAGKHVDRRDLRKGDLVFFRLEGSRISHVGIYLGKGMFIHANRTGGEVRVSMLSNSFWRKKYAGARSVL